MRDASPLARGSLPGGLGSRGPGARFASGGRRPPPIHPRSRDEPEHRHARRPRQSTFGLAFGLTIAMVAISIIAILALTGRERPPSFSELKTALGVPASGKVASLDIGQVEFMRRLEAIGARRQSESFGPQYVYLFYEVREGQAQIVLDRGAWEVARARVRQITLR